MKVYANAGGNDRQAGSAMLIAIFTLLLISVIAIAMVVSTGTDSALASNYRTSAGSYYAALAGIEEARGRLLWKNPDYINKANAYPLLMNGSGLPTFGLTQVFYIVNPATGETVDPTSSNPANYPDSEYQTEYGWPLTGAAVNQTTSVSPVAGLPGPSYKWVRITPATEKSLNMDVDGNGIIDAATPLYYDAANINTKPGLIVSPLPPATAVEALEVTALAVLPNGTRRMLQYLVAPIVISPSTTGNTFPAALTLDGNGVIYQDPNSASYKINGQDGCSTTTPPAAVQSITYTNAADYASIHAQALSKNPGNYPGSPMYPVPPAGTYAATSPSIPIPPIPVPAPIRQSWQSPATLNAIVQDITNSADVVINTNATGSDISSQAPTMSFTNPMTIVVNGNLNLTGWHNTGFGLLLVTGVLTYDPDATWNGVVLVIGQGIFSSINNGSGGINGSVLVAKTLDSSGNLLTTPTLGSAFFGSLTSYGSTPGFGINYRSCAGQGPLGQSAQGPLSYKVLSFHEIPLT
ncbi:MAG TPA: hypothetical protein VKH45_08775 [Candidatus Acidoferrum sp.]|nr:hypothetical protein [Candidatus Acidoferrum sp.]